MSIPPPTATVDEEDLRKDLRELLQKVTRREPLDTTYKHLIMNGVVTPRKPVIPNYKVYTKSMPGCLRECLETFGQVHEWDRIAQRQHDQWDESSLRAAFTLREPKKHEIEELLEATLAAKNTRHTLAREAYVEAMALGLQSKELKVLKQREESRQLTQKKVAQQQEEERTAHMEQQQRNREAARRRREMQEAEEEEEERREEEQRRQQENTPGRKVSTFVMSVFQNLWDMEFANLGNTNPFRTVIDKTNCVAMGVPDYCSIVKNPMNLTWIQRKLEKAQYESLAAFFADVDLMLQNALLYNSDPNNDYHLAAKEMYDRYKRIRKQVSNKLKKMRQANT
jgi:Bromodomain